MYAIVNALTIFLIVSGALWFGTRVARRLPSSHLVDAARTSAQIGISMMATLSALVLGLLITSAHSSFNRHTAEVVEVSTSIVLIDRALSGYGEESLPVRRDLREFLRLLAQRVAPDGNMRGDTFRTPLTNLSLLTQLQKSILAMTPANDSQRWFRDRALQVSADLGHQRVLSSQQRDSEIPVTLLVVLTSWMVLIFFGLGVFTVGNRSVNITLVICALGFAAAVFLILELQSPFSGVIGVSGQPVVDAVAELAAGGDDSVDVQRRLDRARETR